MVRYESVMRMRNALAVLGKMEGITAKEKGCLFYSLRAEVKIKCGL